MYPSYYSVFHYMNALDEGKKGGAAPSTKPKFSGTSNPINIPPKKPRTS